MMDMSDSDEALDAGIDLTPLIDVVFMLLIFFIMATTFSKPILDLVLPAAQSAEPQSGGKRELVIAINSEGQVFHDGTMIPSTDLADLFERHQDLAVNLQVDEGAPFKAFIAVLDQAKMKGREQIAITTQPVQQP